MMRCWQLRCIKYQIAEGGDDRRLCHSIETEFRKLRVIVDKTGGEQEKAAFAFLQEHLDKTIRARSSVKERVS